MLFIQIGSTLAKSLIKCMGPHTYIAEYLSLFCHTYRLRCLVPSASYEVSSRRGTTRHTYNRWKSEYLQYCIYQLRADAAL